MACCRVLVLCLGCGLKSLVAFLANTSVSSLEACNMQHVRLQAAAVCADFVQRLTSTIASEQSGSLVSCRQVVAHDILRRAQDGTACLEGVLGGYSFGAGFSAALLSNRAGCFLFLRLLLRLLFSLLLRCLHAMQQHLVRNSHASCNNAVPHICCSTSNNSIDAFAQSWYGGMVKWGAPDTMQHETTSRR